MWSHQDKESTRGALEVSLVRSEVSIDKHAEFEVLPRVANKGVLFVIERAVDILNEPVQLFSFQGSPLMELFCKSLNSTQQIVSREPRAIQRSHAY